MMKISDQGIEFIKSWEGLRLKPYHDAGRTMTVGYGHVLRETDHVRTITKEEAEAYLRKDVRFAEQSANAVARKIGIGQCQFDMLVSLIFNIGSGAFYRSQTRKQLLEYETAMMAIEWMGWNKVTSRGKKRIVEGLLNRREAELRTFFTGEYHYNQ